MAIKKTQPSVCPECGEDVLTEETESGFEDMCAFTKHFCPCCGAEWEENYSVQYCGYNKTDENGQTIIYDAEGEEV